MTTWSAVSCSEEPGSRSENGDDGSSFSGTVVLRCDWADRIALITDVVYNHRSWPWEPNAVGRKFSIKGVTTTPGNQLGGQALIYDQALITLTYEPLKFQEGGDEEIITEDITPSVEYRKLDYQEFTWGEDGEPILEKEAPSRRLQGASISRTVKNVRGPLNPELLSLQGYTNDDAYESILLGLEFEEETLLFAQPTISYGIRANQDEINFEVGLDFEWKAEGWNKYWRVATQTYESLWTRGDPAADPVVEPAEYKNYPPADMKRLLY